MRSVHPPAAFHAAPSRPNPGPDTTASDTTAPADRVRLPELTIEATRAAETLADAPFSVAVQSRSPTALALTPSASLDDVLRPLPGIWVNDRHHFALGERISVRGVGYRSNFGVRGVQVLYDGIPLTLPDGQAFLDVVDPAVVRQVELVRSPSAVFWGNGSGGVLFLSSSTDAGPPPNRVRVQGGSHGRWQGLVEGGGRLGGWSLHASAAGPFTDTPLASARPATAITARAIASAQAARRAARSAPTPNCASRWRPTSRIRRTPAASPVRSLSATLPRPVRPLLR
jgi:outer membrane receptor protein involved in Fe transport